MSNIAKRPVVRRANARYTSRISRSQSQRFLYLVEGLLRGTEEERQYRSRRTCAKLNVGNECFGGENMCVDRHMGTRGRYVRRNAPTKVTWMNHKGSGMREAG
jgi:hypothetical protein